jgi:hypothetical protein
MAMKKTLAISCFVASLVTPCVAQNVGVVGSGQLLCSDFVAAVQNSPIGIGKLETTTSPEGTTYDGPKTKFIDWARGFITGYNYSNLDNQATVDTSTSLEVSMLSYCNRYPTRTLFYAVTNFLGQQGIGRSRH